MLIPFYQVGQQVPETEHVLPTSRNVAGWPSYSIMVKSPLIVSLPANIRFACWPLAHKELIRPLTGLFFNHAGWHATRASLDIDYPSMRQVVLGYNVTSSRVLRDPDLTVNKSTICSSHRLRVSDINTLPSSTSKQSKFIMCRSALLQM